MARCCCWMGSGGIGGGVPRRLPDGKGGGGGGSGGGGGGGVLELRPAARAGDWGLLSEKPELELERGREGERRERMKEQRKVYTPNLAPDEPANRITQNQTPLKKDKNKKGLKKKNKTMNVRF